MITDEQVKIACVAYDAYNVDHNNTLLRGVCSGHAMRNAIEDYEQSKWVKFDEYDESTYPPFDVRVLTKLKGDFGVDMGIDFMTHSFEWYNSIRLSYVTHWQPLPTFNP